MTSEQRIIYITGRGGDAGKGLGAYLKTIDPHRIGLSVNSIFLSLPFDQQISTIHDLLHRFDSPNTSIIANSYGAYLLTSSFIDKPAIASQVLLLSPLLGLTLEEEEEQMFYSRPPNQRSWSEALEQGRMNKPSYLEVCAGELDGGACSPTVVMEFSELIKADQVQLIPDQGHQLDRSIVQVAIGEFLAQNSYLSCLVPTKTYIQHMVSKFYWGYLWGYNL